MQLPITAINRDFSERVMTIRIAAVCALVVIMAGMFGRIEQWQLSLPIVLGMVLYGIQTDRPVWAASALVFLQFTSGLSREIYVLLTAAAVLLVLPRVLRGNLFGARGMLLFAVALAYVVLATAANAINANLVDVTILYAARVLFPFLALLIIIPASIRTREDLVTFCWIAMAAAALSGLVAVMQHYQISGLSPDKYGEVSGLGSSPSGLGRQLSLALAPLAAVLLFNRISSSTAFAALAGSSGIMALGLLFTYARASILGMGVGIVVLLLFSRGKARGLLIIGIMIAIGTLSVFHAAGGSRLSVPSFSLDADNSTRARPVLWKTAFWMVEDNFWLGVGRTGFKVLGPEYIGQLDPTDHQPRLVNFTLGRLSPHNDFLHAWVAFGIVGIALFVAFHAITLWNFYSVYRMTQDWMVRGLAVGGIAALGVYFVNESVHVPFDHSFYLGLMMGFSIALYQLARSEPYHQDQDKTIRTS